MSSPGFSSCRLPRPARPHYHVERDGSKSTRAVATIRETPWSASRPTLAQEIRYCSWVNVPSKQASESHQHSERRRDQGCPKQPAFFRERRQRQERDRQRDQRVRQIELIVAIIEGVVRLLISHRGDTQRILFRRLVLHQGFVLRDRRVDRWALCGGRSQPRHRQ